MHIYFSGIGGAGIGPLALVAHQAGYEVSGSDKQDSAYLQYLQKHGISDIHIGQTGEAIAALHDTHPIDWFVYTSALPLENPDAPELLFCAEQGIRTSKRDELLNTILQEKGLKLIAVAGTHGKTTTTAMAVWLFKQLGLPLSYALPAKVSFGDMGCYDAASEYFVYEADEFDRNFLAFEPHLSLITGVGWDHHEIFPTREDYQAAFREFMAQSQHSYIWQEDADYLEVAASPLTTVLDSANPHISKLQLAGLYNRLDAWLVVQAVHRATKQPLDMLVAHLNRFPGLQRRMEQIVPGLYSDYAHTPEKIRGAMSVATEMAADSVEKYQKRHTPMQGKEEASTASEPYDGYGERGTVTLTQAGAERAPSGDVVVVYEPLTNRRQHYMLHDYQDCFAGASRVYWLPSYLARENPSQRIIPPAELISHLADPAVAVPAERDDSLKRTIQAHLAKGDMVVCMAGGGGNSLDDWLRREFLA